VPGTPDKPVRVDSAACHQFVSVRDGSALDVAGAASQQSQPKGRGVCPGSAAARGVLYGDPS
jgi:hypothetical protein